MARRRSASHEPALGTKARVVKDSAARSSEVIKCMWTEERSDCARRWWSTRCISAWVSMSARSTEARKTSALPGSWLLDGTRIIQFCRLCEAKCKIEPQPTESRTQYTLCRLVNREFHSLSRGNR